jgi:hypothetical protein
MPSAMAVKRGCWSANDVSPPQPTLPHLLSFEVNPSAFASRRKRFNSILVRLKCSAFGIATFLIQNVKCLSNPFRGCPARQPVTSEDNVAGDVA